VPSRPTVPDASGVPRRSRAALVVAKRIAFTGLANFSTDCRVTGSLWEMHTDGAVLDGYLGLAAPRLVWLALRAKTPWEWLPAIARTEWT
jgi:hypothetical protein